MSVALLLTLSAGPSPEASESILDTLRKGVNAVKKLVDKVFPASKEDVCKAADNRLHDAVADLQCLESYAKKLNQESLYNDCWRRYGAAHQPTSASDWADAYCKGGKNFTIYKNAC